MCEEREADYFLRSTWEVDLHMKCRSLSAGVHAAHSRSPQAMNAEMASGGVHHHKRASNKVLQLLFHGTCFIFNCS